MLTGRLGMVAPEAAKPKGAVVLRFGAAGRGHDRRVARRRGSPDAGWLPADEAEVEIRYLDPTRMGKLYLVEAGRRRPRVPGTDPRDLGPDADDPA